MDNTLILLSLPVAINLVENWLTIVQKSNLFLMKVIFHQVGIQEMFLKLIEDLLDRIDIICFINID